MPYCSFNIIFSVDGTVLLLCRVNYWLECLGVESRTFIDNVYC